MTDERKPRDNQTDDPEPTPADPTSPAPADTEADAPADAIGAYLLDALPEGDRDAYAAYLAESPAAQAEARELAPAVALLPHALASDEDVATAPESSPDLRDRLVAAALAERPAAPADQPEAAAVEEPNLEPPTAESEPVPIARRRPQGRIRGGVTAPEAGAAPTLVALSRRAPAPWLAAVAAAVTLVAIGAILWALALQGRIDSKDREIAALRRGANATAYTFGSSETGGPSGTLLFSLKDQIGVLYVRDLPPLARDTVYQLWYLDSESPAPRPGATFTVDADGNGVTLVASDTPSFDGIALTREPKGGSPAPTTDILLQGNLGGAAG